MSDFIESQGSALIAHRLRRSSDAIVDQVGALLVSLDLSVPPRGASMLMLIDEMGSVGVVEIARRLRLSHPLIIRMARQFEALGLVSAVSDPADARRRQLVPTDQGRREAAAVRALNRRLGETLDELFAEIGCPLPAILDRLDAALSAVPLAARLASTKD